MQAAIDNHRKEMEARVAAEKLTTSLSEELEKAHHDASNAKQQVMQTLFFFGLFYAITFVCFLSL